MPEGKCTPAAEEITCPGLPRLAVVESDLAELRRQNAKTHERFGERIGELEKHNEVQDVLFKTTTDRLGEMSITMREQKDEIREIGRQIPVMAQSLSTLQEGHKATDNDVEEIKAKPAKRWDNMTSQILAIVAAAIVGFILAKLGISS